MPRRYSKVGRELWRQKVVQGYMKTKFEWDDEAAVKLIWLALRNITKKWSRSTHDWKTAMNQFAILFAERFAQTSCDYSTRPEQAIPDRPSRCPSTYAKFASISDQ